MNEKIDSPELIRERALRLLELYDNRHEVIPEDAIGLHGTSVEALKYLINNGSLPGSTFTDELHDKGDLFFAPNLKNLDPVLSKRLNNDPLEPEAAEEYGEKTAKRMAFLAALELDPSDNYVNEMAWNLTAMMESSQKILNRESMHWAHSFIKSVGPENFDRALAETENYSGVTLAISKSVLDEFEIDLACSDDHDLKIVTGAKGLSMDHISIIDAHGEGDKEFFEELRKKFGGGKKSSD